MFGYTVLGHDGNTLPEVLLLGRPRELTPVWLPQDCMGCFPGESMKDRENVAPFSFSQRIVEAHVVTVAPVAQGTL